MSYEPRDTYLPSASGGAQVPQLVGQREEAARAYAASAGWSVHVRHVPPTAPSQPDGFVVRQEPSAGSIAPVGAVLAVDVSRRPRFGEQYGRPVLVGAAAAFAAATFVFASLWLDARHDPALDGVGTGDVAAQLAAANDRIADLEAQVESAAAGEGGLAATLQAQLDEATSALSAASEDLTELRAQLDAAAVAASDAATRLGELETERNELLERVADLEAELGGVTAAVVAMPDWIGRQQVAVEEFVRLQGLVLTVQTVDGAETASGEPVAAGTVLVQAPEPGVPLVSGSSVVITVVAAPAG